MTESQENKSYTTKDEREALGPDGQVIMISDVDLGKFSTAKDNLTQTTEGGMCQSASKAYGINLRAC